MSYRCEFCNKTFKKSSNLTRHLMLNCNGKDINSTASPFNTNSTSKFHTDQSTIQGNHLSNQHNIYNNQSNQKTTAENINPLYTSHLIHNPNLNNTNLVPVPIQVIVKYGNINKEYEIIHPWIMKMNHDNSKRFWFFINKDLYDTNKPSKTYACIEIPQLIQQRENDGIYNLSSPNYDLGWYKYDSLWFHPNYGCTNINVFREPFNLSSNENNNELASIRKFMKKMMNHKCNESDSIAPADTDMLKEVDNLFFNSSNVSSIHSTSTYNVVDNIAMQEDISLDNDNVHCDNLYNQSIDPSSQCINKLEASALHFFVNNSIPINQFDSFVNLFKVGRKLEMSFLDENKSGIYQSLMKRLSNVLVFCT